MIVNRVLVVSILFSDTVLGYRTYNLHRIVSRTFDRIRFHLHEDYQALPVLVRGWKRNLAYLVYLP